MGGIATFDKQGSHFQRFGLKIFVIATKAGKTQKLGVRNGLHGVVRMFVERGYPTHLLDSAIQKAF